MSWQASDHVRKLRNVSATEKAVLYSLADRHNVDDKGCWPRIKLIAQDAGLSPRATQDNLYRLRDRGVIRIVARRREDGTSTSNFYSFVGLDEEDTTQNLRGTTRPAASHESPIEKTTNKEKFDQVLKQYPQIRSEVVDPDKYFSSFDTDLDFDPDNVVAAIRVGDLVRGSELRAKERIRVPVPSRWAGLDRVGAYFRRQNGKLDLETVGMVLEDLTNTVKAGPAWDNVLDIMATYPETFLDAYREAVP